jgi:hypothetical protein
MSCPYILEIMHIFFIKNMFPTPVSEQHARCRWRSEMYLTEVNPASLGSKRWKICIDL